MTYVPLILTLFLFNVLCVVPYASFGEWFLHRNVMHRTLLGFTYPHETHTYHHNTFKADDSYHLGESNRIDKISMAWWNGIAIAVVAAVPFCLLSVLVAFVFSWVEGVALGVSALGTIFAYYCVYEYLHWCMHDPKDRWIERRAFYQWLNRHHRGHHSNWKKNLNVVLPLADWRMGTLLSKSKVTFAQA